jgi:hypothetical protein
MDTYHSVKVKNSNSTKDFVGDTGLCQLLAPGITRTSLLPYIAPSIHLVSNKAVETTNSQIQSNYEYSG